LPSAIARSPGVLVDHARDRPAVLRRERFDELPHSAVTEQQDAHHLVATAAKNFSWTRPQRRRQIRLADHERDVPPRRRLRHHAQRHVADRGQHLRGQARIVVQAVADHAHDRHVILRARRARIPRVPSMIAGSRRASSIVTDTLTSDVVTTSTAVLWRSNTSNRRRRKPCAISMRVDVMSTTVTPFFDATAVSGRSALGRSAVISVPRAVGAMRVENAHRNVARDRRLNVAGCKHLRAEVGQLRCFGERQVRHRPTGFLTMRGSAVSMPSTSVQI
jgi:hypothetical protein